MDRRSELGSYCCADPKDLLLDTHTWFWYLTGSPRLPGLHRQLLDRAPESRWLSPICVWEMTMLVERGRIRIQGEPRDWVTRAFRSVPLRQATLNHEVALLSREVDLPHRDPADRFIAATALVYDLVLLTVDARLAEAPWLPTA